MRSHARVSNKLARRIVFVVYIATVTYGCTVLMIDAARPW
jgi:hypothetical protein